MAMWANCENFALKPEFVDTHVSFETASCVAILSRREPALIDGRVLAICTEVAEDGRLAWRGHEPWHVLGSTTDYLMLR